MIFVTVLFAQVSNVFKKIETNYGLVIETKVHGENISTNNVRGGGGQRRKKLANHVIKSFPRKTMRMGRGGEFQLTTSACHINPFTITIFEQTSN